ncbi:Brp/Blh family beta-carotene 15,15'-dioxygenase [Erythrobacter sp. R86502]|uniref:Brp/Blh family beta-carotene 15,15'-dioxygenase n=1 Tax=Erythrobacter sp. R86502 TaxID=3093846 RepID=UPI0036D2A592
MPAVLRWPRHVAGAIIVPAAALAAAAQLTSHSAAVALGAAFFLAGLAHGAGQEDQRSLKRYGLAEAAAYVALAAAFAGLFLAAPLAGLAAFLALSAWHFAQNAPARGRDGWADIALALVTVGAGALLWPQTTGAIFAELIGAPLPDWFMIALAVVGAAGIALTAVAAATRMRGFAAAGAAVLAAAVLHPVLAVGFTFFAFHALPETMRQIDRFGPGATIAAIAPTMALALVGASLMAALVVAGLIALPIAAAAALGLTVPHMLAGDLRE